jgi:protein-S-isoprenylcysteine O-methyltransferase Ste14
MPALTSFVAAAWVVFWIYWMVSATGAKTGTHPRLTILPRAVIIILVVLLIPVFKGHHLTVHSPALHAIGVILLLCGLGFAVWARIYLGRNWGMPMTLKDEPELVTSGPYHFVRHPIYSGILLAALGTSLAITFYWLLVLLILGTYFIYSATVEERIMISSFPTTYPDYKLKTKMLIPFVL